MSVHYHKLVTISDGTKEATFKIHEGAAADAIQSAISSRFGVSRFSLVDDEDCYVCVDSTLETGKYRLQPVGGASSSAGSKSKQILMVVTNNSKLGSTGKQTGWYLPEVAHPFDVFTKGGYKVVYVSPLGGKAPCDEGSIEAFSKDESSVAFLKNKEQAAALEKTLKPSDVKSSEFAGIFYAGGYGPMWDLPENKEIAGLASKIYESGGVVGAVCHGPVGLAPIKLSDGTPLIQGKKVTGFSNAEEQVMKLQDVVPFLLEDKLKELGGKYSAAEAWASHVCSDQRVVTGQNPASAGPTATAMLEAM